MNIHTVFCCSFYATEMPGLCPFHLAIPVSDIESTRRFYCGILGCETGRNSDTWIDFNFFGHQLSAHVKPEELTEVKTNLVDGKAIPVRHFGIVLVREDWEALKQKLENLSVEFMIKPVIRFPGKAGEQATFFIRDPSGNVLEFKAFGTERQIFAVSEYQV